MHQRETVGLLRAAAPRSDVHVPSARVGVTVDGRYRLVREIACGGGGVVFEAVHVHTGARVAVKTMSYTRSASRSRARVLREARALGMLRHPNIVPVLDAGDCPQCGPYLALELIEGRTLESFITARGRLEFVMATALAVQLGAALNALAERQIVHRDVKPSNVLIVPGACGSPDTAILIDFGVAKIMCEEDPHITNRGDFVGTPLYMAPEQVSTTDLPVDHRTDVYGLGALIYECLTGLTPFTGHPLAVAAALVAGTPPPPIRSKRPDVPPALESAVLRALAHRPQDRWPDAASFARACSAAAGGWALRLYLAEGLEGDGRRAARSPYQAPARLLQANGRGHDARIEDISVGGLLVATGAEIAAPTSLEVRFPLPMSGEVITLGGCVRWTRPGRAARVIGIEFSALPEHARREIEAFSRPSF